MTTFVSKPNHSRTIRRQKTTSHPNLYSRFGEEGCETGKDANERSEGPLAGARVCYSKTELTRHLREVHAEGYARNNGAEEYVLHPTVEDAEEIFRLRDRSGRVYFDLQRKVLMFGNLPVDAPGIAGLVLRLLGGR